MSKEAQAILAYMLRQLGWTKYLYDSIIEGCIDSAINHGGYAIPVESNSELIMEFKRLLHQHDKENL